MADLSEMIRTESADCMAIPPDPEPLVRTGGPAGGAERPGLGQGMGKHYSGSGRHTSRPRHHLGRTACPGPTTGETTKGNCQAGKTGMGGQTAKKENGICETNRSKKGKNTLGGESK